MGESQDDPALRAGPMGEALYARINPRHEHSEPARRYAYSTPVNMAKELLTLRGESTMALSPASLVTRALHTTSDFPIILGDTVGRVLRDAYHGPVAVWCGSFDSIYLAIILELHSRRVMGWAVSNRMKRDLAIRAIKMAIA